MTETLTMKTVFLTLLSTFIGWTVFAAPVAGILEKNNQGTFLTLTQTSQKYKIASTTGDAVDSIERLNSGDYITGNGDINEDAKTIQLNSLDYVGLKKILGLWYSGGSVMNFSTFTDLSVYPLMGKNLVVALSPKTDLHYSLAPYSGNQWAIFLSSQDATVFATIEFSEKEATMHIFDSETGQNTRTMRLVRWSH